MNIQIKSYCQISSSQVFLNGNIFMNSVQKPTELQKFLSEIYNELKVDYRKFFKMDTLSKLGFLTSELLLDGFDKEQPKEDMGILFFNRSSSLEADKAYQQTIQEKDNYFPSPSVFVYTLPNIVTGEIAIRNKIHGETAFYIFPQFQYKEIEQIVKEAMLSSGLKYTLAGWIEVAEEKVNVFIMLCEASEKVGILLNSENIEKILK